MLNALSSIWAAITIIAVVADPSARGASFRIADLTVADTRHAPLASP